MKTTLDINNGQLATAKSLIAQHGTTLAKQGEEGLQLRLRSSLGEITDVKRKIPVFKGQGGLVAGLNPISNKAMLDAIDEGGGDRTDNRTFAPLDEF